MLSAISSGAGAAAGAGARLPFALLLGAFAAGATDPTSGCGHGVALAAWVSSRWVRSHPGCGNTNPASAAERCVEGLVLAMASRRKSRISRDKVPSSDNMRSAEFALLNGVTEPRGENGEACGVPAAAAAKARAAGDGFGVPAMSSESRPWRAGVPWAAKGVKPRPGG